MPLFERVTLTPADDNTSLTTGLIGLFVAIGLALVVLFAAAVVSIVRSDRLGQTEKAVWIIGCLILQFFGPLAWFVWGRHQHSGGSNRSAGA